MSFTSTFWWISKFAFLHKTYYLKPGKIFSSRDLALPNWPLIKSRCSLFEGDKRRTAQNVTAQLTMKSCWENWYKLQLAPTFPPIWEPWRTRNGGFWRVFLILYYFGAYPKIAINNYWPTVMIFSYKIIGRGILSMMIRNFTRRLTSTVPSSTLSHQLLVHYSHWNLQTKSYIQLY